MIFLFGLFSFTVHLRLLFRDTQIVANKTGREPHLSKPASVFYLNRKRVFSKVLLKTEKNFVLCFLTWKGLDENPTALLDPATYENLGVTANPDSPAFYNEVAHLIWLQLTYKQLEYVQLNHEIKFKFTSTFTKNKEALRVNVVTFTNWKADSFVTNDPRYKQETYFLKNFSTYADGVIVKLFCEDGCNTDFEQKMKWVFFTNSQLAVLVFALFVAKKVMRDVSLQFEWLLSAGFLLLLVVSSFSIFLHLCYKRALSSAELITARLQPYFRGVLFALFLLSVGAENVKFYKEKTHKQFCKYLLVFSFLFSLVALFVEQRRILMLLTAFEVLFRLIALIVTVFLMFAYLFRISFLENTSQSTIMVLLGFLLLKVIGYTIFFGFYLNFKEGELYYEQTFLLNLFIEASIYLCYGVFLCLKKIDRTRIRLKEIQKN